MKNVKNESLADFRVRIERLRIRKGNKSWQRDVISLVRWIERNHDFCEPLKKLGLQKEKFEKIYTSTLHPLRRYFESMPWGNYALLKQANLLSQDSNPMLIGMWFEGLGKDENIHYLDEVADFIHDDPHGIKPIKLNDEYEKYTVWNDQFRVENHVLMLQPYGQYNFYPSRSPAFVKKDIGQVEKFIELIIKAGKEGVPQSVLNSHGFSNPTIGTYLITMNGQLQKYFWKNSFNAYVQIIRKGSRGHSNLKLAVLPSDIPETVRMLMNIEN